jgi:hypothetical protein
VANLSTCVSGTIASQPYYSDCRWHTQNVAVRDNVFSFNPADIGSSCTASNGCGLMGLFSNWGTYPSWSPYQGDVIEVAITSQQNNVWSSNSYTGPWQFMVRDQGNVVSPSTWQATWGQDVGSTFS